MKKRSPINPKAEIIEGRVLRRRDFLSGVAAGSTVFLLPGTALSSADECEVIAAILQHAQDDYENPGTWAISLDPTLIPKLQSDVAALRALIEQQKGIVDATRRKQLLSYAEAVGGTLLIIGGFTFGLAPTLIAGIAFSGTMLIARAVSSPEKPGVSEVLQNVAGSRVPAVLETFGEGATVLSRNAATYGKVAGAVTSVAFTAYSFVGFAKDTNSFQSSTVELQRLRQSLAAAEAQLLELSKPATLQLVRQHCAMSVIEELNVVEQASCNILP